MNTHGKRVFIRQDGRTTSMSDSTPDKAEIVGWFANKYNQAHGWVIAELDDQDRAWFASEGESTDHVYRLYGQHGTTLAKFRVNTGTVSFFDNKEYEKTDRIHWDRFSAYDRLFID